MVGCGECGGAGQGTHSIVCAGVGCLGQNPKTDGWWLGFGCGGGNGWQSDGGGWCGVGMRWWHWSGHPFDNTCRGRV